MIYLSSGVACQQIALYESILASPHRTLNGDEADFFFVPVLDSCLIDRADHAPHLSTQVYFHQLSLLFTRIYRLYITTSDLDPASCRL